MSARTVVHLLRHGEVHNPDRILYGRLPGYLLSHRGEEMARLAADHLAERDVAVLVSSPLERARQTTAALIGALGVPMRLDDRLIEAENSFQGRPFSAARLTEPAVWPLLVNPFRPSWGEAYTQIAARMCAVIDASRAAASGHEAVLVGHQLPIETVRRHLLGQRLWHDPRQRRCKLASITSLTYVGDDLQAITYTEPARTLYAGASPVPGA